MKSTPEIIGFLREQWSRPQEAIHRGKRTPFLLACSFADQPAERAAIDRIGLAIPPDVRDLWSTTKSASLFKDQQFSQWGLELLDPTSAARESTHRRSTRHRDFCDTDLVLGRFLGDSDLLVIRCEPDQPDYGSVLIALPLDKRSKWPVGAKAFAVFLECLLDAQGDKYW